MGNPLGPGQQRDRRNQLGGRANGIGATRERVAGATLPDFIQTSAAINPAKQQRALVDLSGRVVGIPTLARLAALGASVQTVAGPGGQPAGVGVVGAAGGKGRPAAGNVITAVNGTATRTPRRWRSSWLACAPAYYS